MRRSGQYVTIVSALGDTINLSKDDGNPSQSYSPSGIG